MQASWARHEAKKDATVDILLLHFQGLPKTAQYPHQLLSSLLSVLLQCKLASDSWYLKGQCSYDIND